MAVEINAYRKIIRSQLAAGGKISDQMRAVIEVVESDHPHHDWGKFRKIPYDRLASMRNWLTHRFSTEPPQTPVTGLWFGLCHTRHGSKSADLYLSASTRFSRDDLAFRWTLDPEYQPDYCFARSDVLWKIYQGAYRKKGGLKQVAEQPLCLAYAAFVIARLLSELAPQLFLHGNVSAGVAVGFAADKAMLLGELTEEGFLLADPATDKRPSGESQEKLKDRNSVWNLIAEVIAATGGNLNAFERMLDDQLSGRKGTEILAFSTQFCELLNETCTWDVYGAATIIGCDSEDAFLDFRRWIVFQGPRHYARILKDVDCLGSYDPDGDPVEQWYSEYHPLHIYQKVTGRNPRNWQVLSFPEGPGMHPSDKQLASRFPRLWKRLR